VEDTVSPLTALGRVERLGAESEFRRNIDAAERVSILERRKRSIIKLIGFSRYLAVGRLL